MGERGLPCRILAPKFAGVLTFGALGAGRESAPGQPTVQQLRALYRLPAQRASTQARRGPTRLYLSIGLERWVPECAPGQPTVQQLRALYRLPAQRASRQARSA